MRLLLGFVLVGLLLVGCSSSPETAAKEQVATDAALEWLALLDQQDYAASWRQASMAFQVQISSIGWVQAMRGVTSTVLATHPNLDLTQRQLVTARYTNNLPDAPPGDYVVVQFETPTTDAVDILETVALYWEADAWKVQGYYIVPSGSW